MIGGTVEPHAEVDEDMQAPEVTGIEAVLEGHPKELIQCCPSVLEYTVSSARR